MSTIQTNKIFNSVLILSTSIFLFDIYIKQKFNKLMLRKHLDIIRHIENIQHMIRFCFIDIMPKSIVFNEIKRLDKLIDKNLDKLHDEIVDYPTKNIINNITNCQEYICKIYNLNPFCIFIKTISDLVIEKQELDKKINSYILYQKINYVEKIKILFL
jgi:hypothetical protein